MNSPANSPDNSAPDDRLPTASLRRRVTLSAIAVLAVVLVALTVVVAVFFSVLTTKSVNTVLADRSQQAQSLARQNVTPANLLRRIDTRSVRAKLTLSGGRVLGSLADENVDSDWNSRTIYLSSPGRLNNAKLTLAVDISGLSNARKSLIWVLVFTGIGALVLTALLLTLTARISLAPLDAMTALARSIVHGQRGRRLRPSNRGTELGRTAEAFDDMLDALEGAERQALSSEFAARGAAERTKQFVADAAHELRTPIAGVQAVAEALAAHAPNDEQRQRLTVLLVRESRRASRLVDDLLDLAKIDAGIELQWGSVDLLELANTQVDRVRLQHAELAVEIYGSPLIVDADSARISQILANVLDNACQATPAGGRVSVTVESVDGWACVSVADTGPGVAEADSERIFDRLVRLDSARDRRAGGSGLGLAVARGLARAHGGELSCERPPPGVDGALFRLSLPGPQRAFDRTVPVAYR